MKGICFLPVALVLASAVAAGEWAPLVKDVSVSGNRKISADRVLKLANVKPGARYSEVQIDQDVARIKTTLHFKKVNALRVFRLGRVDVVFQVEEYLNVVREVILHNAVHVGVADLEKIGVRVGMPLDPSLNKIACFEIVDQLKQLGYYFAQASLEEGQLEKHERVVFNVNKGPLVQVRRVGFFGIADWQAFVKLAGVIATKQAKFSRDDQIYQPAVIDDDVHRLAFYFQDKGYLNAKISRELFWTDDFRWVDVIFHIDEGKRFRIADLRIHTDGELPRAELERLIKIKKGDYYDGRAVQDAIRCFEDWGGRQGKRLDVTSKVLEVPDKEWLVNLVFHVSDAPVHRVGAIHIVGNTITRDDVIRKQISLRPGAILDYTQLRVIERKLANLGIFRVDPETGIRPTVSIVGEPDFRTIQNGGDGHSMPGTKTAAATPGRDKARLPVKKTPDIKDIVVRVEETQTWSVLLAGAFSLKKGAQVRLVLEERNFDAKRWPMTISDLGNGRAFHGAGQKFRVDSGLVPLLPPVSPLIFGEARQK